MSSIIDSARIYPVRKPIRAFVLGAAVGMLGGLIGLGGALLTRRVVPAVVASVFVALCASGHGYAHGVEMLRDGNTLPLVIALLASSTLIVAAGYALGWQVRSAGDGRTLRVVGAALAVAGGLLLGA